MSVNKEAENGPANQALVQELSDKTAHHLFFLETWTKDLPTTLYGVDVVRCLNYELIQVLNHAYLGYRLGQQEAEKPAEELVNA